MVGRHRDPGPARLVHELRRLRTGGAPGHVDGRPGRAELDRDAPPRPTCGAGDEGDLSLELFVNDHSVIFARCPDGRQGQTRKCSTRRSPSSAITAWTG